MKALKYPFRPAAWLVVALVAFCTPVKSLPLGLRLRAPSLWSGAVADHAARRSGSTAKGSLIAGLSSSN